MGQKKEVKLEDISRVLGISVVTVSNALNGKKGVSDATREKIFNKASELGYEIKKEEKQKKKAYRVGVIVAERYIKEFPSFYMDVYKRVAQETTRRGGITVLEVVDEKKEECAAGGAFSDVSVDGVIVIGQLSDKYIEMLKNTCRVPLVCVDYYDVDERMDYVLTDGYGGMEEMVEMLVRAGYRSFQFVGNPLATRNIMDRYMGYCKALERNKLSDQQGKVISDRETKGYYRLDVEVPQELPEVFVCNCDKIAKILIDKLQQRGISVPDDVGVTGFDNFHPQTSAGLLLTTYENDEKRIAQASVGLLFRRIEGKKAGGIHIIEGRLIEGDTVRKGGPV